MWGFTSVCLLGSLARDPKVSWFKLNTGDMCSWDAYLRVQDYCSYTRKTYVTFIGLIAYGAQAERLASDELSTGARLFVEGTLRSSGRGREKMDNIRRPNEARGTNKVVVRVRAARVLYGPPSAIVKGHVVVPQDEYKRLKLMTKDLDPLAISDETLEQFDLDPLDLFGSRDVVYGDDMETGSVLEDPDELRGSR